MLRTAGLSILVICALVPATQEQAAPPPPPREATERGALAILRRDGILFPFASFNRDSWRVTWPIGLPPGTKLPITVRDVPDSWWGTRTPEMWHAFLPSGEVRRIGLEGPIQFHTYCSRRVGLRSTYRSALELPPALADPFPKDGVAVSGYARIEPIQTVAESSPEWKPLEAALLEEFDRVERMTIAGVRASSGWRHPLNDEERRRAPMRIESWYRSPGDEPGWTVSYVEAVRAYPARPEDKGCGLETLVTGWVQHLNGELKDHELRGQITYCDRVGASYMLPFGRIRPRDHSYWIFQLSGWEEEWYGVVRIDGGKVRSVIHVLAGNRLACP